ncbi:GTPase domain-containing protein [Aspergillus melleus]|uniref:GTPase domain-containing protein n=1 Tax=Aspergillus melleus TaxID=138277 RepID=UPI001E8E4390|nr:uncharacterized protein LDX57_006832 [Aspergillus melleus]KAH8429163.1 hypothetical protein LDX57_006832 [Aspergillus melleus]
MPNVDGWKAFTDYMCSTLTEEMQALLENNMGTSCLLVTGGTGTGKSSFIKCITTKDVYVGSTLESGTKSISLVPSVIHEKLYMFLDMPGFNADDLDDWETFSRLMNAMAVLKNYVVFRGVIYVDPMDAPRASPAARNMPTWLSRFCGIEYMRNVTVVTTKWDLLSADGIEQRLERVGYWKEHPLYHDFVNYESVVYHHGLVQENGNNTTLSERKQNEERKLGAENMIAERYRDPSSVQLQVDIEIENGASIYSTEAGRWLKRFEPRSGSPESSTSSQNDGQRGPGESSGFWAGIRAKDCVDLFVNAAKVYRSMTDPVTFSAGPSFDSFESTGVFEDVPFFGESSSFDGFE